MHSFFCNFVSRYSGIMKNIFLYFKVIIASIQGSFRAAYQYHLVTGKFRLPEYKIADHLTDQISAVRTAEKKAREQNMPWHVISPIPDKYCAVSERYLLNNPQFKSLLTCKPSPLVS